MARICPACGASNDESLGFCNKCGEPISPEVRLAFEIKEFEKAATARPRRTQETNTAPRPSRYDDDDIVQEEEEEEKKNILPILLVGAVVVAVVVFLFLK